MTPPNKPTTRFRNLSESPSIGLALSSVARKALGAVAEAQSMPSLEAQP